MPNAIALETEVEFENLVNVSGVTTFAEAQERRVRLINLTTAMVDERSQLKLELSDAIENFQAGGPGKGWSWRRLRVARLDALRRRLMILNAALTELKLIRFSSPNVPPGGLSPISRSRMHHLACHFIAVAERELGTLAARRLWDLAVGADLAGSKIDSELLGDFCRGQRSVEEV